MALQWLKNLLPGGGGAQKRAVMFDAAGMGRRLATWNPPSGESINNAIWRDLSRLRDRSRDAVRKSPYAARACRSWVGNAVGAGIKPSLLIEATETRKAIHEAFRDWTDEADADGRTDFYGLQSVVARQMFSAGECLVRLRPRRVEDGLTVPLQLQVLAAEHLPLLKNWTAQNGNEVRAGIEFDRIGRRVAYHLYRNHPGDRYAAANAFETVRVPAAQVLHLYESLEPGQLRGIPFLSTILLKLYELDQYDDAELVRKKIAAMIALLLKRPVPEGMSADDLAEAWAGVADGSTGTATLEAGTMLPLEPGEEPESFMPADVGGNYEAFMKIQLHAVAAGMGVTYEQLTGDLKGVNYSSIRAGLLEFRRQIEQFQHQVLVFQFCRPVWNAWIEAAVMSGAVPVGMRDFAAKRRSYQRVKWIPQAWPWVDPVKDRLAEQIAVRNGFKARSDVIEAEGYDPEETEARIRADNKRADEAGFVFDSDPRMTAKSGAIQKAEEAAAAEASGDSTQQQGQ